MRLIVRREKPHPGAALTLFEHSDGLTRYQAFVSNTTSGRLGHARSTPAAAPRVGSRTGSGSPKDTGLGRLPSRDFKINTVWAQMIAARSADLSGRLRSSWPLHDHPALAKAEPKLLRFRMRDVPATVDRGGRRRHPASPDPGHGPQRSPPPSPGLPPIPGHNMIRPQAAHRCQEPCRTSPTGAPPGLKSQPRHRLHARTPTKINILVSDINLMKDTGLAVGSEGLLGREGICLNQADQPCDRLTTGVVRATAKPLRRHRDAAPAARAPRRPDATTWLLVSGSRD